MVGVREHLVRPARPAATAVAPERIQRRAARRGVDAFGRRLGLQAKLIVGAADDRFEQEADAVADAMARSTAEAPTLGRTFPGEVVAPPAGGSHSGPRSSRARTRSGRSGRRTSRRRSSRKPHSPPRPLMTHRRRWRRRSPGRRAAGPSCRRSFASASRDSSDTTWVMSGSTPAWMRQRPRLGIGARAFTVGRDVFFGRGEYRPGTSGRRQAHRARGHPHDPATWRDDPRRPIERTASRRAGGGMRRRPGRRAGLAGRRPGGLGPGTGDRPRRSVTEHDRRERVQRGLLDDGIEAVLPQGPRLGDRAPRLRAADGPPRPRPHHRQTGRAARRQPGARAR